jgi:hypothetical protein
VSYTIKLPPQVSISHPSDSSLYPKRAGTTGTGGTVPAKSAPNAKGRGFSADVSTEDWPGAELQTTWREGLPVCPFCRHQMHQLRLNPKLAKYLAPHYGCLSCERVVYGDCDGLWECKHSDDDVETGRGGTERTIAPNCSLDVFGTLQREGNAP